MPNNNVESSATTAISVGIRINRRRQPLPAELRDLAKQPRESYSSISLGLALFSCQRLGQVSGVSGAHHEGPWISGLRARRGTYVQSTICHHQCLLMVPFSSRCFTCEQGNEPFLSPFPSIRLLRTSPDMSIACKLPLQPGREFYTPHSHSWTLCSWHSSPASLQNSLDCRPSTAYPCPSGAEERGVVVVGLCLRELRLFLHTSIAASSTFGKDIQPPQCVWTQGVLRLQIQPHAVRKRIDRSQVERTTSDSQPTLDVSHSSTIHVQIHSTDPCRRSSTLKLDTTLKHNHRKPYR